jgi:hypothetical protein
LFAESLRPLKGDNLEKHDEAVGRRRRNFLKAAGGAAMAFVATKDGYGQSAGAKSPPQGRSQRNERADRGLWVTWYDLREDGRDAYLSWLHGTYLPEMLKRPGYLWAAHYVTRDLEGGAANSTRYRHVEDPNVGTGYRYILLIAATDANIFGNPVPSVLHAALPEQSRKMLAMRIGERVNLMTETGRRRGRAEDAYKEGLRGAPCIQIGSYNCPTEYEEEMHAGYVQQRLPSVCDTPSCIRVRKLNSVAGWAKHGILYEFASEVGFSRDYEGAVAKSPLGFGKHSVVPMLIHAPNGPNSARRVWPPVPKA